MNTDRSYKRIILGKKHRYAEDCFAGNFIGADFGIHEDLSGNLPERWQDFNAKYTPKWMQLNPEKSMQAAGNSCGMLWAVCKGLKVGDVVICPDGKGSYRAGEIAGDYKYAPDEILPHRRAVSWLDVVIPRASMSQALKNSTGSIGTSADITQYAKEIESYIGPPSSPTIIATDEIIEDPSAFAMEAHLEDFLVANWSQTSFGAEYDIYEDEEQNGKQFQTPDAGRIDILAISKTKDRFLVLELKRGRASDVVVGQTLRYMGWVKKYFAYEEQAVEGVIIGLEDDQKLRYALSTVPSIRFYRYEVDFRLIEGES